MPRKNTRNTKGKIISAAWKLFYENGYDGTTIEDIIDASGTSRGSFYHYFDGKDALLGTLAYVFDEKYEALRDTLDPAWNAVDKLIYLNHELFLMIEDSISRELLSGLLSTQLQAQGGKHLLDRSRTYFRILREIIAEGLSKKELRTDCTASEIIKAYAMWERA
ncbi:MAG TPA: TetR/AcrR family transcriptional regulator, partial [Lachnospiraceae bacterium]|nr:TetR/AcrR family transcriptional regulator [Lachnospiraceae bacterium]